MIDLYTTAPGSCHRLITVSLEAGDIVYIDWADKTISFIKLQYKNSILIGETHEEKYPFEGSELASADNAAEIIRKYTPLTPQLSCVERWPSGAIRIQQFRLN